MSQIDLETDDFFHLFLSDTPLMDVRAPVEFAQGAFPSAHNCPLLDDAQREQIGIEYKTNGQNAAIALGNRLATPKIREARITIWKQFIRHHPDGALYCFRGGLRSRTTQHWLAEMGIHYPLVTGGYKALRRFLIERLDRATESGSFILLSGRTGVGKTHLLNRVSHSIDLEALAHHRGSTFGRRPGGQPSQIDFENRLAIALLKQQYRSDQPIILEDESQLIGRCCLPHTFHKAMKCSPILVVEEPLEARIEIGIQTYVCESLQSFQLIHGVDEGFELFSQGLADGLFRLRKRLGGVRFRSLDSQLGKALQQHREQNSLEGYRPLIATLLQHYYDPMYDYQLNQKNKRIVARGDSNAIAELCNGKLDTLLPERSALTIE